MTTEPTFYSLINDLERYLRYQQAQGVQRVEIDRALLEGFADLPEPVPPPSEAEQAAALPALPTCATVEELAEWICVCERCPLAQARRCAVPGNGCATAPELCFVGGAPDTDDEATGWAFDGEAGALLTRMIEAMGYLRDEVFVTHAVKCRPPADRPPTEFEQAACLPYLQRQIELVRPKVLVAMGAAAVTGLTGQRGDLSWWRGTWLEHAGIRVMPTYHPATLLRDPAKKKEAWSDLRLVMDELGRKVPAKR